MESLTQLFKLVRHAVRHHRKKASASISLTLAALGYLNLDKLQPLAEAVQAEAQALLMKHASRDVMLTSAAEHSASTTPRAVEQFLPVLGARLDAMCPLDRLLSEMKTASGAARVDSLTNYRIQSTTSCVNATLLLAVFTSAVRLATVLFDKLGGRIGDVGLNAEELRANVLRLLAVQLIERGLPSLASLVTPVVKRHIANCSLPLTDPASPDFVSVFFQGIITEVMSNEHSCGGGLATLQSPASTGSSGLGGGWFMADPGIGSPSSYSPPSPSEASVVVNVLQSPLASLPGSVLLSVLIGSASADVAAPSIENRIALRVLDVLWDIMESAAFTPALLSAVQVAQEVLVSAAQYCAFPDARPVSVVVSRVSELKTEADAVPPASSASIKPVTHVNVILAFRNALRRLLRADIPETVPFQVAQCPELSEMCVSVMQHMVVPDSVFLIPVGQD